MVKIIWLLFISLNLFAKVEPPNYDFSLDNLKDFMPGQSLKTLKTKYKYFEEIKNSGKTQIYKTYVEQIRYKFPIYIQTEGDKLLDFHARLPAYFLHNVFHQSLVNRLGLQDRYFANNNHALYVWKNKDGVRHTYTGACSITCYPIYYSVSLIKDKWTGGYKPLTNQYSEIEK